VLAAVSDVVYGPVADIVCPIALSCCREVASADPITLVQERTCLQVEQLGHAGKCRDPGVVWILTVLLIMMIRPINFKPVVQPFVEVGSIKEA